MVRVQKCADGESAEITVASDALDGRHKSATAGGDRREKLTLERQRCHDRNKINGVHTTAHMAGLDTWELANEEACLALGLESKLPVAGCEARPQP